MKLEVTEKGVYDAKGNAVAVGTLINVKGDSIPASLVNKCRVVGVKPVDAEEIINPADNPSTQVG